MRKGKKMKEGWKLVGINKDKEYVNTRFTLGEEVIFDGEEAFIIGFNFPYVFLLNKDSYGKPLKRVSSYFLKGYGKCIYYRMEHYEDIKKIEEEK